MEVCINGHGGASPMPSISETLSHKPSAGEPSGGAPAIASVVEVRLNLRRLWRWHFWLIEALARRHARVFARFVEGAPLPRSLTLLLGLERLAYRLPGEHACDPLQLDVLAPYALPGKGSDLAPDLILDLSGAGGSAEASRLLRTSYDGSINEDALFSALLAGASPILELSDISDPGRVWTALPAIRDPQVLTRALDAVFSRQMGLCLKGASAVGHSTSAEPKNRLPQRSRAPIAFAAAGLAGRISDRLHDLCRQGPQWFIGWRLANAGHVHCTQALPDGGYRLLPDDKRRYYADPFLVENDGVLYLFCEEFDYALGRGLISVTTLQHGRTPATPRPVLERSYHLSYPHVFAHAGQIWMIPESTAARTVELYRAARFPDQWERAATLLSDIVAADATILHDGDRWWMFAATAERQSSDWDALSLWYAPDLFGPWTPHPANPVLVDARAARPAGHFYRRKGRLFRPAQDCTTGYGGALALCTIDRLDPENYQQTTRAVVRPGPSWPGRGLHTLNWAAGVEVVDGFGSPALVRQARNASESGVARLLTPQ